MKTLFKNYSIGILLVLFSIYAVLLYSFPVANYFSTGKGLNFTSFLLSRFFIWSILPLLFLYVKFIENGKILIKKENNYSFVRFCATTIILLIITAVLSGILNFSIIHFFHEKTSPKLSEINTLLKNNFGMLFFVCLTAAVTEEIIFRGYIQARLQKIYNNSFISITITAFLFGLAHFTYGTISNVAIPILIGLIFGIFYQKYSNIKVLIVVHFLIDFISLIAMAHSK
jgi:membrane protease YdiL (CAAX protease family)